MKLNDVRARVASWRKAYDLMIDESDRAAGRGLGGAECPLR
jgi:hypothetical protein